MNFNKFEWNAKDFDELNKFININKRSAKDIDFEKRIVNTKLSCLAIKSSVINEIVKNILKSNYIAFLQNCEITNYPISIIYGKVLTSIKNYNDFVKYFNKYSHVIDCWAHCDIFKLNIKKIGKDNIINFINKNICSANIFIRRICIIILLKSFINCNDIEYVFTIVNKFYNEQEYYVNMAIAWLLCDCFIKQRFETLKFIQNNKLNDFVLNKFISKCCDSFRISNEDKIYLKSLRKKEG